MLSLPQVPMITARSTPINTLVNSIVLFLQSRCLQAAELRAVTQAGATLPGSSGRRKLLLERPTWESDDASETCRGCGSLFSISLRKHHCRSCGTLCCNSCSTSRMPVPYLAYFDPQRVCDDCAQYATPPPFIVGSFVFPFLQFLRVWVEA